MSLGVWFWIILVLSALFRGLRARASAPTDDHLALVGDVILVILLAILGWAQFGAPAHS